MTKFPCMACANDPCKCKSVESTSRHFFLNLKDQVQAKINDFSEAKAKLDAQAQMHREKFEAIEAQTGELQQQIDRLITIRRAIDQ